MKKKSQAKPTIIHDVSALREFLATPPHRLPHQGARECERRRRQMARARA